MLTQPTDYFYVLFIPGDTGDTAGHDLEHVKRLQEPGMEVTEFFVSQVPSHTVHAQQGTKLHGFSAEYSMTVHGGNGAGAKAEGEMQAVVIVRLI